MLTIIGSVLILLSIVSFAAQWASRKDEGLAEQIEGTIIGSLTGKYTPAVLFSTALAVLLGVNGAFFKASASTDYVLQYPFGGTKTYVNTNGIKPLLWADKIAIDHEIIIKQLVPKQYQRYQEGQRIESENTHILPAGDYEFNDFISSHIGSTVVITTAPENIDEFTKLAIESKSETGLVYGRVVPQISAAKKNTAKLMAAQEYIAGRSSDYDKWFLDQLRYGTYELIEIETEAPVDSLTSSRQRTITTGAKTSSVHFEIKMERDSTGLEVPVRINEGLARYGLQVRQADADDIQWESAFTDRLTDLKGIVAEKQREIEMTEKAREERKRLIEEGESKKAKKRADLEEAQIERVIQAETAKLEEQEKLEAARLKEETAKVEKRTTILEADAAAYKNLKLVNAGLTPQKRAEIEKEIAIGVATELAKMKLPATYFAGGGEAGENGLLTSILGAELAKQFLTPKLDTGN